MLTMALAWPLPLPPPNNRAFSFPHLISFFPLCPWPCSPRLSSFSFNVWPRLRIAHWPKWREVLPLSCAEHWETGMGLLVPKSKNQMLSESQGRASCPVPGRLSSVPIRAEDSARAVKDPFSLQYLRHQMCRVFSRVTSPALRHQLAVLPFSSIWTLSSWN